MKPPLSSANGSRPQAPPPTPRTTILHMFAWGVRDRDGERELLMAPSVVRP